MGNTRPCFDLIHEMKGLIEYGLLGNTGALFRLT